MNLIYLYNTSQYKLANFYNNIFSLLIFKFFFSSDIFHGPSSTRLKLPGDQFENPYSKSLP